MAGEGYNRKDEMRKQNLEGLPRAFKFAIDGLWLAFTKQRNFQIHFTIAFLVLLAGVILVDSAVEITILIFAVVLGLVAEMLNTAVEELADVVSPGYNAKVKVAKDVAAGMVLLSSVGLALVGLVILVPPLLALF